MQAKITRYTICVPAPSYPPTLHYSTGRRFTKDTYPRTTLLIATSKRQDTEIHDGAFASRPRATRSEQDDH